ncbi:PAS domain S-box/diguanylate cyclase (GGDEF) domain-containing protein [Desulfocapsa sulfexigens DSM 10523]|uniref:diguanylate cyclase n=1 Tax=Desulfocapsa sulfexigens (strain DSM 10523 / SB164P1) TaxID=1167006 RepID=M1PDV6_DESSD|nr:CBS domain-containing protein [Desulfocapsa sulfexigens]AGF77890.1 PAS domain S-box/diguanylate cyclase (GGDEF) domain-containing protein [Desulfocapsa sulfexigens DSM 10523]
MCAKRLSEIMTPGVVGVSPDTPVFTALELLRNKNISCILVLEDNEPVGIFTERKVVQLAAEKGLQLDSYAISDIMTSPVLTASRDMDIYSAYNILSTHKIRHLVVVDENNKLCGVATQSNIVDHLGYEYFIEFKKIFQVMTTNLFTVSRGYSVEQTLQEMAKTSTSCLLVAENERPVGIVTERDMTRLLINGTDLKGLNVEDIMSHPVHTAHLTLPLLDAARIMKETRIRRIVVVDADGKIAGLTTQSDIIKGLHGLSLQNLKQLVVEKDRELEQTSRKLAEKTVYLDNILHSSVDLGMVAADLNYHIVYFNPAAEKILDIAAIEVIGRDIRTIHKKNEVLAPRFDKLVEMIQNKKRHEFTFIKEKEAIPCFVKALVTGIWDPDQSLIGFVLMLQDVTERTLAERKIKRQKSDLEVMNAELSALYAVSSKISQTLEMEVLLDEVLAVITNIEIFNFEQQGGIFVVDGDKVQLVSHIGLEESCLGYQNSRGINDCPCGRAIRSGETLILDSTEFEKTGLTEKKSHGAVIVPIKAQDKVIGGLCLFTPPDFAGLDDDKIVLLSTIGNQIGIAMENARLYEQTRFLSLYDPLTNVANRRLMTKGLEKYFSLAKRYKKIFSIIMLDIDNFKKYNDTHGHSAGDKMLVRVATVLLDDIRNADVVARYGGEEFLIMLPEATLETALLTAERIRQKITHETGTTISLGVATYDSSMTKNEQLINKADEALYRAKKRGKNRVEY